MTQLPADLPVLGLGLGSLSLGLGANLNPRCQCPAPAAAPAGLHPFKFGYPGHRDGTRLQILWPREACGGTGTVTFVSLGRGRRLPCHGLRVQLKSDRGLALNLKATNFELEQG
eukprot:2455770-Rhodomonas_salina.1